ncbi:MAG: hypothetical protein IMY67_08155 [Bacteroidetes bacterium]|nr:hypothetical protein [Bacteroidota bacterium]
MNSEALNFINTDILNEKDKVIISFNRFSGIDEIHELDMKLYENIPKVIGRYDGHEIAMDDSHGTLFAYGNNAEKLFKAMQPILNEFDFLNEASVYLYFNKEDETFSELEFIMNK